MTRNRTHQQLTEWATALADTKAPARDPRTFSGLPPADFDALDADLLDALRATGGRTTTCPDGYTFRDTCPICD